MAASLELQDTKRNISGDNDSLHYRCTITGNYPADGYEINAAEMPNAVARFARIYRIIFNGGNMDEDGIIFRADPDEIDNDSETDPHFHLRAYEIVSGGTGYNEISVGDALATEINLIIEGVPLGGVRDAVGETW